MWLFSTLEDIQHLGGDLYRGRLPDTFDFNEVVRELEAQAQRVLGVSDGTRRSIEFYPIAGNVYLSVEQLVSTPINLVRVPEIFTVRELCYTAPSEPVPKGIQSYFDAVQLWTLMAELADYAVKTPSSLFFLESPNRKIELIPGVNVLKLEPILGLDEFSRDFVRTDLHREQKRNIVRSAILEILAGHPRVKLEVLIERFEPFLQEVRASYAIFAADFSYQKVRSEIEKQNLDDTLRLNKTLAEIQNQLLALPAALILAAAGLEVGKDVKNIAIVIGVAIFALLMMTLVANQKSSVCSIDQEVTLRKELVARQPIEVSSRFGDAFVEISTRVAKQRRTLNGVLLLIAIVVACVAGLAWHQGVSPKSGSEAAHSTVPTSAPAAKKPAPSITH